MKPQSYTGVAGIMTPGEGLAIHRGRRSGVLRPIGLGVLASAKTLFMGGNKHPNRYPRPENIGAIFRTRSPFALNFIHYAPLPFDEQVASNLAIPPLHEQLAHAFSLGGAFCDGIQVNAPWPDPIEIRKFACAHPQARIILQVKRPATRYDEPIGSRLEQYAWAITDILLDESGGTGKGLSAVEAEEVMRLISELEARFPHLGIGVAGALCADELEYGTGTGRVFRSKPDLSIDAEGLLRDIHDRLETGCAIGFVNKADEIIRRPR